jgi:hypothetical protein
MTCVNRRIVIAVQVDVASDRRLSNVALHSTRRFLDLVKIAAIQLGTRHDSVTNHTIKDVT